MRGRPETVHVPTIKKRMTPSGVHSVDGKEGGSSELPLAATWIGNVNTSKNQRQKEKRSEGRAARGPEGAIPLDKGIREKGPDHCRGSRPILE